jgi:hypothetical protein
MRRVLGTLYSICEDDNYVQSFCRVDDVRIKAVNEITGVPVQYKLFCVSFPDGNSIMILAEDEARAKGQATCKAGFNDYETQREIEKTLVVTRVPFRIQGWSANTY